MRIQFCERFISTLTAWSRKQCPLPLAMPLAREAAREVAVNSKWNPLFIVRQRLPAQSPVSSKSLVARKIQRALNHILDTTGGFPSSPLHCFSIPCAFTISRGHRRLSSSTQHPIRMHEIHGLGNQQGPCSSRFLSLPLDSPKTTKRKPPREVRPSLTGPRS
jgi:hypothetical protein